MKILTAAAVFTNIITLSKAASISSNIEGAMVCPGEELILTCTSQGTTQRWVVRDEDGASVDVVFTSTSDQQGLVTRDFNTLSFEFALISVAYDHFESTVSAIIVSEEINNTRVECIGRFSRDFVVLTITGVPLSPQGLVSRVLKSSSENFIVEVTWDPPDPDLDSRTDFYHYQVLDGLQEENASVALDFNTTNTTVIIDLNGLHTALFVLSAWNCEGTSTPVAIVIHNDPFTTDIKSGVDTSNSPVTVMLENDVLLASIYSLCGAVVFILLITCLILSLVFLKLLRKKDQESSLSQARAQCVEDDITTEEEMDNLKVDLSISDKIDIDSAVYENIKC